MPFDSNHSVTGINCTTERGSGKYCSRSQYCKSLCYSLINWIVATLNHFHVVLSACTIINQHENNRFYFHGKLGSRKFVLCFNSLTVRFASGAYDGSRVGRY